MGIAAYNRGSLAISESILRDFEERNRSRIREQMQRASDKIVELEQYSLDAQALFIDITDEATAIGFLRKHMHLTFKIKSNTRKFQAMLERCNQAHCHWVDSDHRHVFSHLAVCHEKASAWQAVLTYLNLKGVVMLPITKP